MYLVDPRIITDPHVPLPKITPYFYGKLSLNVMKSPKFCSFQE